MTNGWQKVFSPYSGASYDYQHYHVNGVSVGHVQYYNNDGDWGYAAYINEQFAGTFNSREKAQAAVEKGVKKYDKR